jgi:hypothetical protein
MRKVVPVAALLLLGACAHGRGLGGAKGPDEFAVARQAPLVIPPDFALQPPQPGAAAQTNSASAQALDALFGGPAQRSGSERAAVDAAGGDQADPGIRSAAGDPATNVVDKGATTRDIVAAPEGDGQDARAAAK